MNRKKSNNNKVITILYHNGVVFPTRENFKLQLDADYVEKNYEHFQRGKTAAIFCIFDELVVTISQAEKTGVAARIIEAKKEDNTYVVTLYPFKRIIITQHGENGSEHLVSIKTIKEPRCDEKHFTKFKDQLEQTLSAVRRKVPDKTALIQIEKFLSIENSSLAVDDLINKHFSNPHLRQVALNMHNPNTRMQYLFMNALKTLEAEISPEKRNVKRETETPTKSDRFFENVPDHLKQLAEQLSKTSFSRKALAVAENEFNRLKRMGQEASEAAVVRNYLNWLMRTPWYTRTKEMPNLKTAQVILNNSHYGMRIIKETVLELLAVRKLNPERKGKIICLIGPPGTGKTSIAKAVAKATNRKFVRFSMGGIRDEAEIRGHRRTYIGALPGKLISLLADCGTKNPVILIDEIDKITRNMNGDPSAALLEVLDPEQNKAFVDSYLEVPVDLSEVLFIATANNIENIEAALRDRMEIIEIPSYTKEEKTEIAKKFLIPKQLGNNGIKDHKIEFTHYAIEFLISGYTREAGVRNLEREIEKICRKTATKIALGEPYDKLVTQETIVQLIGNAWFEKIKDNSLNIGEAKGLAWTPFGGVVLKIQVAKTKNVGQIETTGSLGEVMKESITIAKNLAIKHSEVKDFLKENGLQIHAPAGAVPKDGPSAGITLFMAIYSAISEKMLKQEVAMTGEIDIFGRVTSVGGLREKISAAQRENIETVILSKQNENDRGISELPNEIKNGIRIIYVNSVEEALPYVIN